MITHPEDFGRATPISPLTLLCGDDILLMQETAQLIRDAALRAGYIEREVFLVEPGFSWSSLSFVTKATSLFSDKKWVDLRIPSGKPGVEGAKALEAYAAELPQDTVTLVSLPALDRTTRNAKWFSALSAAGQVIEVKSIERAQLPQWIVGRLARQQQYLSQEGIQFLAERVEGNLLAAMQEIQKLALLYPIGEISISDLQSALSNVARYDIFQLGNALLEGDAMRVMHMLDGLQSEGVAPHRVLWILSEELRLLYRIGKGWAKREPLEQLLKTYRVWGHRRHLIGPALTRIRGQRLRHALIHAGRIDQLNKGIGQGNAWDELRMLVLPLLLPKVSFY